jgi:probable F420-dependent oxidoreductase
VAKEFRFGLGLHDARSRSKVEDAARRAEEFGFDVLHVPDHLGAPAPFPALTMAAAATSTLRLGTFVLNAGFYKPALLARDVAALRDLSGERFELGLGAGYVRKAFEAAELPFPTPRQRVDYLQHVTEYMREHARDVPILIAGNGDRLLAVAARLANIIGLTGGDRAANADQDPLAERIEFVRAAAGDRFDDLELNIAITAMPIDGVGHAGPVDSPPLPADTFRRGTAASSRRVSRLGTRHGRPDPRLSRHLRGELHHRAGSPRRTVLEGHRRTEVSSDRSRPRSSGDRARLS